MNPLFGMMNPLTMLSQLRSNPLALLRQCGFNVPQNLNNPNDIIQHLMNSGQISQSQYEQARQMAQQFSVK